MGQTIRNLASRDLDSKCIFNNRFVVELAEKMHIHYRNLRIVTDISGFKGIGSGCASALSRWKNLGNPNTNKNEHTELCRHSVSSDSHNDGIKINLNKNLYKLNKDKIFADGTSFDDENYIHLKIRDLRLEMSIDEFKLVASAFKEAEENLNGQ